jgi:putative glutamine amidotransferase
MNQRYYLAATQAGAVPWMIPLIEDLATLREIYDRLDGLLLAGGVDMDPATYNEEKSPLCGVIDPPRDLVEMQLARWALADGKPIFGICRGLQVLNVVMGGSLFQDVTAECSTAIKHDYVPTEGWSRDHLAHEITIHSGTRLHAALGTSRAMVNSMHHQGIDRLGEGLAVTAVAPDGLIEAIEAPGRNFLLGVQWHPEAMTGAHASRLLAPFLEACG